MKYYGLSVLKDVASNGKRFPPPKFNNSLNNFHIEKKNRDVKPYIKKYLLRIKKIKIS